MKNIPAYKIVYSSLKQSIRDGSLPPGSFLPTETELCKQFNVSKTTIRKAISLLAQEGHIRVTQGRGTEVLDSSTTQQLNTVSSFTETLVQKGYSVSTRGAFIQTVRADAHIAKVLNIPEGASVYNVQRVQCADGAPIAIMENYLVADMFPNFHTGYADFISLYATLEKDYHLIITKAEETIMAATATFIESQILNVEVGEPLLISKRVTYCDRGPFDYSILKIRGDKYSYSIHLAGR